MSDQNHVFLEGNVVAPPVLTTISTGTSKSTFSIGCNRSYKKGENWIDVVSFFNVEVMGKRAENVATLVKGQRVSIEGRLDQDRWENSNGENRSRVYVHAHKVRPLQLPKAKAA